MSTVAPPAPVGFASRLRRLYLARFTFAIAWAGLLFVTTTSIGPVSATLLVGYPLFDLAAAVVDARSSGATGPRTALYINMGISLAAGLAIGFAVTSGIPAVLRAWGMWAAFSGLVQLTVGVRRRALGGQWPMMISGTISTVAGISFFAQASSPAPSLRNVAGYAVLGGIFFLISALRMNSRPAR